MLKNFVVIWNGRYVSPKNVYQKLTIAQIRALDHPAVPANSEDNAEAATLPHTSLPTNSVDAMV